MKLLLIAAVALSPLLAKDNEPAKRLDDAAIVLTEVMSAPDKGIPKEMLEHAHCIVIVPDLKTAAFIVGGKYGKGYISCRKKTGPGWSAPGTADRSSTGARTSATCWPGNGDVGLRRWWGTGED